MNTVNTITYHKEGDYLLPDLVPPEPPHVGGWGMRRRKRMIVPKDKLLTWMNNRLNA